ncbi:hypothetical protein ASPZODRAFT_263560 [Penicilliopsis zonata CBS 506.65]|uniref:FAD-binding domain-containing protein n=1 Tax=Penicilliopsis zonata CBS 506.65 TaxID=1073090 RepID=A0A1L9SUC3_9EURO|nr:hypothetical protein ASPZODRAFT_263560 [Penicilliopsis zonata CBS 506.65]OJJ50789.1 hypothetical protein ASPZODRAFT_263560 [Penicilliopsis zonata CBS 506.65]
MTSTEHVDVLIIGGGIVGLSMSLFLSHHGIRSLLVERHSGTSIHPRARSVNARTMEIYRGIGISQLVRKAGESLAPSFGIYSGSSLKTVVEAKARTEGKKRTSPFQRAFADVGPEPGTFVTQDMLEPVILKAAKDRGVDVRFRTECLGVEQDKDQVTARIRDRESGTAVTVTASYLVAADGVHSPIRSQLGIATTGRGSMGHLLNILFHADLKPLVEDREFSICVIERPEVTGAFTAINNSDRWVFHMCYDPAKGETPEDFPPEKCKELLKIALGISEVTIEIISILPWEPSVRVATHFQQGRIFLAGDAAHQMPPYGGQGANTGISDAHNLAWKLAAVLHRQADPSLLETYNLERRPVGKAAAEASASPADERGLISVRLSWKTVSGFAKIAPLASGFGYLYPQASAAVVEENRWPLGGWTWKAWSVPSLCFSLDGRPGSRAPHVWVEKEGQRVSLLDLFGKGFVLLAGSEGVAWLEASQQVRETLKGLELASYRVGPTGDIVEKESRWETAAGISPNGALLVRPDGFVAWRQRRMPGDVFNALLKTMQAILCQLSSN